MFDPVVEGNQPTRPGSASAPRWRSSAAASPRLIASSTGVQSRAAVAGGAACAQANTVVAKVVTRSWEIIMHTSDTRRARAANLRKAWARASVFRQRRGRHHLPIIAA